MERYQPEPWCMLHHPLNNAGNNGLEHEATRGKLSELVLSTIYTSTTNLNFWSPASDMYGQTFRHPTGIQNDYCKQNAYNSRRVPCFQNTRYNPPKPEE